MVIKPKGCLTGAVEQRGTEPPAKTKAISDALSHREPVSLPLHLAVEMNYPNSNNGDTS